jgi:hypothetical protein
MPRFTLWPTLSRGELRAWMKNNMVANRATHSTRKFSRGQVPWTTSNPWTINLAYGGFHLEGILLL